MMMIDPMIQIILIAEIGHITETGHRVETGTTPKNTKEMCHTLEINCMAKIHIIEINHETTVDISIGGKVQI